VLNATYKVQPRKLREPSQAHRQLFEGVAVQIQILHPTKLRTTLVIIDHILEINVGKELSRKRLKLVVRCDDRGKIYDLAPRDRGIIRIVLVHVQYVIRNLLQAHCCHVQAPIYSRAIDTLSQ
jgi:hypothetical protein